MEGRVDPGDGAGWRHCAISKNKPLETLRVTEPSCEQQSIKSDLRKRVCQEQASAGGRVPGPLFVLCFCVSNIPTCVIEIHTQPIQFQQLSSRRSFQVSICNANSRSIVRQLLQAMMFEI